MPYWISGIGENVFDCGACEELLNGELASDFTALCGKIGIKGRYISNGRDVVGELAGDFFSLVKDCHDIYTTITAEVVEEDLIHSADLYKRVENWWNRECRRCLGHNHKPKVTLRPKNVDSRAIAEDLGLQRT